MATRSARRGRYHLYLDESGTHDMRHIDVHAPYFVLMGLLVGERYYAKTLAPALRTLKACHFGDPNVVLHSNEIRRCQGAFRFLYFDEAAKNRLYADLNAIFTKRRFRLYAVAVDKTALQSASLLPPNPYFLALNLLLSLVCGPRGAVGASRPMVSNIIAESRGKVEDRQLQSEYQRLRLRGLANYGSSNVQRRRSKTIQRLFPNRVSFVRKAKAIAGLELADLAAYPLARVLRDQNWDYPTMRFIEPKLRWEIYP